MKQPPLFDERPEGCYCNADPFGEVILHQPDCPYSTVGKQFPVSLRIARLGGETTGLKGIDIPRLNRQQQQVREFMEDGRWHNAQAICYAAGMNGQPASEGLRRLRELREWFIVEKRPKNGGLWEYRMKTAQ